MPVTLKPWAPLEANILTGEMRFVTEARGLIPQPPWNANPPPVAEYHDILQSSFGPNELAPCVKPTTNGLIDTIIEAYRCHRHLVIRPDDIWMVVLMQFSSYVNAHSEELRHQFVTHEGQHTIRLEYDGFNYRTFDYTRFALDMNRALGKAVVDPILRDWVMPSFSTTTKTDEVVASIVMMATLKKYYKYECGEICGLPSVTLLGDKKDFEDILRRVDKLTEYGREPTQFAELLRPVISRLFRSFDEPDSADTTKFWRSILNTDGSMCGITRYGGWITAFMFWDEDGAPIPRHDGYRGSPLELDNVKYQAVDEDDIPAAWVTVPVKLDGLGSQHVAHMKAGCFGREYSSTGTASADGTVGLDRMQPLLGWCIHKTKIGETSSKDTDSRRNGWSRAWRNAIKIGHSVPN